MSDTQQNKKIINNAISAYFMIFVSVFFLFNKENKYLNNQFVKKHTKSALLIHLGFFLSYFVFIHLWAFAGIMIFWKSLHIISASISCLILLWILIFWMYKAQKSQDFILTDFLHIFKMQKIQTSSQNIDLQEREKMNFIMAHIPFIWFVNYAKNSEKKYIQNATKLNLFVSVFFVLFLSFDFINISNFLLLIYSIYLVFIWINIFTTNNIFTLDLDFIPSPEKKYFLTRAWFEYMRNYFSGTKLEKFNYYYEKQREISLENSKINYQNIQTLPDISGPKWLIYIPIINFVCLFQKNKKQKFHIRNGVILSILFILLFIITVFTQLEAILLVLLVFAFCYGYWYLKYNPVYKMPYVYMFYHFFEKLFGKTKDFNTKYNKQEEVHLSVKK